MHVDKLLLNLRLIAINKMMIFRYTPNPPNLQHSIALFSTSKVDTPFSLFNRHLAFPNPLIDKIVYLKGIDDLLSIYSLLFAYTLPEKIGFAAIQNKVILAEEIRTNPTSQRHFDATASV